MARDNKGAKVKGERIAVFHPEFIEDLRYWVEQDRRIALKAFNLIEAILRQTFTGIGKPEPLKADLTGYWSRRINDEHRLVYSATATEIIIIACRYHYSK